MLSKTTSEEFNDPKMDEESRDKPCNLHTCKFCSYGSQSTLMCKHVGLHRTRAKTDTFTAFACDSKAPAMFECQFCGFETNLKVDLTEHFRIFHDGKARNEEIENILKCYRCENCDFGTHSILVLTAHVNCCKGAFGNNSSPKYANGDWYVFKSPKCTKWFKCKHCQYHTLHKGYIKRHTQQAKHLQDEKWLKCEQCFYQARTKSRLNVHMLKHMNSRDLEWFQCKQCVYKSKLKSQLDVHVQRMHNEKGFQCGQCGFQTGTNVELRVHVLMHMKPETINCEHCECTVKTCLKQHNTNKYMKPKDQFQCEHCEYKTKTKDHLRSHNLHRHMKPEDINWFQCEHCEYKAKEKSTLNSHIKRMHNYEKWSQCEQCGAHHAERKWKKRRTMEPPCN